MGPTGPSADELPPVPEVVGVARLGDLAGDSNNSAYFGYFTVRSLKFSVTTPTDLATNPGMVPRPILSDIEITINDQPTAVTLLGNALTGQQMPEVQIILLARNQTGDPQVDELFELVLNDVVISRVQPVSSNDVNDPRTLRLSLMPETIRAIVGPAQAEYDVRNNVVSGCVPPEPTVFANAPGGGNSRFSIPAFGVALEVLSTYDDQTGVVRPDDAFLSDVGIITGLIPETPCFFHAAISRARSVVEIFNYNSALDSQWNSAFTLESLTGTAVCGSNTLAARSTKSTRPTTDTGSKPQNKGAASVL
jgi:type VI protein secretion system component Hcp